MYYQRKRRKQVAEINVVPYIDVMLVLLIIFMATAPLITQGVKVDLPQASADPLPEEARRPMIASLDQNGNYYLELGEEDEQALTQDELYALVRAQMTLEPDMPVVVRADRSVSYADVMDLMVLLQRAGAPSVGLMTAPPADG